MKRFFAALLILVFPSFAAMASCPSLPYPLMNGTTADALQVMANFTTVLNCANGAVQLNGVNAWSAGQSGVPVALTYATTITPSFSSGNIFTVTLTGNATLANPTSLVAGQCGQVFITQDGTGSRTLSYGTQWKFPGGTAPTLTTTPGATDILSFCSWTTSAIAAQLTADVR
jgi:hypothetical protein